MNWRTSGLLAALLAVGGPVWAQQTARIIADTNRDGLVTWAGDNLPGKDVWGTNDLGAVFLYNMDDDNNSGTRDCDDEVVNGAADEADLARLLVGALVPFPTNGGTLTVTHNGGTNARLFYRSTPTTWAVVPPAGTLPLNLLSTDLELAIEGRAFAGPSWNGKVRVTAAVNVTGGPNTTDAVELKVAPFLMLGHSQTVTELYVRAYPGENDSMIAGLTAATAEKGVLLRVIPGGSSPYPQNQIWLQDQMEVGYTEMPGRKMNAVLRANRNQAIDEWPRTALLGPEFGFFTIGTYRSAFAGGGSGNGWLDWFGNLEVTPPLPGWPYGRIYYGRNGANALDPAIVNFLNAQEIQGPAVSLDTGWLLIKHVDEVVSFVPTNDPSNPWKALVPDTGLMEALLDQWITDGHGSRAILSRFQTSLTVQGMRNQTTTVNHNRSLQTARIEPLITEIKTAFGLTDDQIVRVPVWYSRLNASESSSMVPNLINSVVMNGLFLIPEPNGPVFNGTDLLEKAFNDILAAEQIALEPRYFNDQRYHRWNGNVHCGTNVRREPFAASLWTPSVTPLAADSFLLY